MAENERLSAEEIDRVLRADFDIISGLLSDKPDYARWPVHPDSSLAKDERATTGYDPLSTQVIGLIHASTDNLHGVMSMLTKAGDLHAYAEYAMIRAGIECAVTAWWLLVPPIREERVTRSLRVSWRDTCDRDTALAGTPGSEDFRKARLMERNATAVRNGINPNMADGSPNLKAMLTDFDARHELPALLVWRATSGMVHGRRWAMLALSEIERQGQGNERMVDVKVTGNLNTLALCYHIACLVLQEAMRLFHMRRQPPACAD